VPQTTLCVNPASESQFLPFLIGNGGMAAPFALLARLPFNQFTGRALTQAATQWSSVRPLVAVSARTLVRRTAPSRRGSCGPASGREEKPTRALDAKNGRDAAGLASWLGVAGLLRRSLSGD
jgi:hypothetical protein